MAEPLCKWLHDLNPDFDAYGALLLGMGFDSLQTMGPEFRKELLTAVIQDNSHLAQILGALENGGGGDGSELTKAALENNIEELEELLSKFGVNAQDGDGRTAIINACSAGHIAAAKLILNYCPDLNIADKEGLTPVVAAVRKKNRIVLLLLIRYEDTLEYAVDCSITYKGKTIVDWAEETRNTQIKIDIKNFVENQKKKKKQPESSPPPMSQLEFAPPPDSLKLKASYSNITPYEQVQARKMTEAASLGLVDDMMECIYNNLGVKEFVDLPNENGQSALLCASIHGQVQIIEELLLYTPDVNLQDKKGMTPIIAAASGGHLQIVQQLIKFSEDVQMLDLGGKYNGNTVHDLIPVEYIEILQLLKQEETRQAREEESDVFNNPVELPVDEVKHPGSVADIKLRQLDMFDEAYTRISSLFVKSWTKKTNRPHGILAIVHIENKSRKGRFLTYKGDVARACGRQDVVEELFHGTSTICSFNYLVGEESDVLGLCAESRCATCSISNHGFLLNKFGEKTGWGRFGRGLYFAENSSKAHDYASNSAKRKKRRMMFVVEVVVGNKKEYFENQSRLTAPPDNYHSVYGKVKDYGRGQLNYSETVVYEEAAVLPTHVIIYEAEKHKQ